MTRVAEGLVWALTLLALVGLFSVIALRPLPPVPDSADRAARGARAEADPAAGASLPGEPAPPVMAVEPPRTHRDEAAGAAGARETSAPRPVSSPAGPVGETGAGSAPVVRPPELPTVPTVPPARDPSASRADGEAGGETPSARDPDAPSEDPPGAFLAGRILDPDGRPVASAQLAVGPAVGRRQRLQAGEDGSFAVAGLQAGTLRVEAESELHPHIGVELELAADERREGFELQLRRGAAVSGVVRSAEGVTLEGVTVSPRPPGVLLSRARRTGFDGRFRLVGLQADTRLRITASAAGWMSASRSLFVPPDAEVAIEFSLEPAAMVGGVVLDAEGEPVARAEVRVRGGKGETVQLRSDGEGRWRAVAVSPGAVVIAARAGDRLALAQRELGPGPTPVEVTLRLGPGGSIAGRVADADGEPLFSAVVMLESDDGLPLFDTLASTDERGRYRIGPVLPGRWRVRARSLADVPAVELDLEVGEERIDVDLTAPRKSAVFGSLQDLPLAEEVAVELVVTGRLGRRARSEGGQFRIGGVDPGSYVLFARSDAGDRVARLVVEVPPGAEDVGPLLLPLGPPARYEGRLVYPDGTPVAGRRLRLRDSVVRSVGHNAESDVDGNFAFGGLCGATYQLFIGNEQVAEVVVGVGEVVEQVFELPRE